MKIFQFSPHHHHLEIIYTQKFSLSSDNGNFPSPSGKAPRLCLIIDEGMYGEGSSVFYTLFSLPFTSTTNNNSSFIKNVGRHKNRFFAPPKIFALALFQLSNTFDSFVRWWNEMKRSFAVLRHPLRLLVLLTSLDLDNISLHKKK